MSLMEDAQKGGLITSIISRLNRMEQEFAKFLPPYFGLEANLGGWIAASSQWIYVSATSFKEPGDVRSKYDVGRYVKWTEATAPTTRYGVVSATPTYALGYTTVTLFATTDFVVGNETLSGCMYSYDNPPDFPYWFNNAAPTMNVIYFDNGAGGQPTIVKCRWHVEGRVCTVVLRATGTKATTDINLFVFADTSIPLINRANISDLWLVGHVYVLGAVGVLGAMLHTAANTYVSSFGAITIADNTVISNADLLMVYEV